MPSAALIGEMATWAKHSPPSSTMRSTHSIFIASRPTLIRATMLQCGPCNGLGFNAKGICVSAGRLAERFRTLSFLACCDLTGKRCTARYELEQRSIDHCRRFDFNQKILERKSRHSYPGAGRPFIFREEFP